MKKKNSLRFSDEKAVFDLYLCIFYEYCKHSKHIVSCIRSKHEKLFDKWVMMKNSDRNSATNVLTSEFRCKATNLGTHYESISSGFLSYLKC